MTRTVNKLKSGDHLLEDPHDNSDDSLIISFINREMNDEANDVWINTKITTSQVFTQKYKGKEPEQTIE